jgi:hypothetical protein
MENPVLIVVVKNLKNGHWCDFEFGYDEPDVIDRILKFVWNVNALNPETIIWIRVR